MNKFIRAAALSAVLGVLAVAGAAAQTFTKPIRVIVPYPAGDAADSIARSLAPKLKDLLGQPIIIDNKPGASGLLGLQSAMAAENDGHTFVLGQMGSMAVAPITNKQPFDVRTEFVPVAMTYTNYMLLVANPALPFKTFPEMLAYSKANPGQLKLATNGEGGFPHLAMELLAQRSGLAYVHIPYKSSSQPVTDVIAGHVSMTVASFSVVYPQVQSGRVAAIGLTGKARTPIAPTIGTLAETVPGYEALGWFGFFATKSTPAASINAFNTAVNAAMKVPEIQQHAQAQGLDTLALTPAQFGAVWRDDYDKWGKLIRELKLEAK